LEVTVQPAENIRQKMAEEPKQPESSDKRAEIMGYMRPMNALWLGLLFVATWLMWSLRAALILLGLMIAATILGVILRRPQS
jgi:hypothetical protein